MYDNGADAVDIHLVKGIFYQLNVAEALEGIGWLEHILAAAANKGVFVTRLAVVLGIKSGLSNPLISLFGNEYVARSVRYFLIVAFAGGVWPLTFKFFERLRIEKLERFTDWVVSKFSKKSKATD